MSRARVKPSHPPSRLLQAILAVGVIALATLRSDNLKLEEDNRNLRLGVAEVASRERLRALAPKFNLGPPAPGQVVTLP